jgi:hypothetical protein
MKEKSLSDRRQRFRDGIPEGSERQPGRYQGGPLDAVRLLHGRADGKISFTSKVAVLDSLAKHLGMFR